MNRTFDGRRLELLAPAGTFAILESLIDSGADAFYAGGKGLNMRLHRRDFNFSDAELVTAADQCRDRNLKLYVTVNSLMGQDDLDAAPGYLEFLAREVRPDALIVQDLAVQAIVAERGLPLPLHASVMMNAHDGPGIRALADLGFSRVVLSRESSFEDARRLFDATGMELEYFAHGDLCAAHGSQCLYSGMLFGQSSNRGRCMKPCRWPFAATENGRLHGSGFPLAVRDLCLYLDLEAAATAGISSFKIEGRMRGADYLRRIVSAYAGSLDRLCAARGSVAGETTPYDPAEGYTELFSNRMRDFTTAFAYSRPGSSMLNTRWEGTGKFYSTGKVFSRAIPEPETGAAEIARVRAVLRGGMAARRRQASTERGKPELAVRVDSTALAAVAFEAGADVVILSGDPFGAATEAIEPLSGLSSLRRTFPGKTIALSLPRMLDDQDYPEWEKTLGERAGLFDELYVTQLGAEQRFRDVAPRRAGDSSLNVLNGKAAETWAGRGLSSLCASIEADAADLAALLDGSPLPVEVVVHGRPSAMYIGLDLATYVANLPKTDETDVAESVSLAAARARSFSNELIVLIDERGLPHPVARDARDRYHFLPTRALALLPVLPELAALGAARFRIDGTLYDAATIATLCAAYRAVIDGADPETVTVPHEPEGTWFGALRAGSPEQSLEER